MITQDFLTEFELCLIKSYTKAAKKGLPKSQLGADILAAARSREDFINEFMATFHDQRSMLETEVRKGGHADATKLLDKVSREVEGKIRASAFHNKLDQNSFQKIVRDLKNDVRSVFYERYLSK